MAVLNNTVRIIDRQTYAGQICLNVYHYKLITDTTPGATLANLLTAFITTVVTPVRSLQNTGVSHQNVEAINLIDPSEVAIAQVNLNGTRSAANAAPSFIAWTFKLQRKTGLTRNGWKRIVGMSEEDMASNTVITAVGLTNAVSSAMLSLVTTADEQWEPVIVRRDDSVFPVQYITNTIGNVILNPLIGSQVSRKVGRGN